MCFFRSGSYEPLPHDTPPCGEHDRRVREKVFKNSVFACRIIKFQCSKILFSFAVIGELSVTLYVCLWVWLRPHKIFRILLFDYIWRVDLNRNSLTIFNIPLWWNTLLSDFVYSEDQRRSWPSLCYHSEESSPDCSLLPAPSPQWNSGCSCRIRMWNDTIRATHILVCTVITGMTEKTRFYCFLLPSSNATIK